MWLFSLYFALACFTLVTPIPIDNGLVLKAREVGTGETMTVCGTDFVADIMFVIDSSGSIKADNFELLRLFLVSFVGEFPDTVQVGAVQFSNGVKTEFSFNTFGFERQKIQDHFKNLQWIQGVTKLGKALDYTREEELTEKKGDRPDAGNIIVVITDGRADDDPGPPADRLRAAGNTIIVIGVTDFVDEEQLLAVGGKESHVFTVENFADLDKELTERILSKTSCREVPVGPTLGEPSLDVECGTDSIRIASDTRNPFEGQVYVKGHSDDPDCVSAGDGTTSYAEITLPHGTCDTTRRRSLNPPGLFVENTVVFKFHPKLVTKVDQAFKIQCFYMETEKTVTTNLEVSMLSTEQFTQQFPMPTCTYTIHQDSPEGDLVKFAVVGQPVYHRWECDNTQSQDLFRMKVTDCFVEDGEGDRVELLDLEGCSIDKYLLQNLDYDDGGMLATVEAHVFKFADKPSLYFQCQIELCVDYDGGCNSTPPVCPELNRFKRDVDLLRMTSDTHMQSPWTMDVVTDHMSIIDQSDLDLVEYLPNNGLSTGGARPPHSDDSMSVCLNDLEMFVFMMITGGSFMIISTIALVKILCKKSL